LPKWKRDATEFTVGVNYNKTRGYQSTIPKPVIETLGNPDRITFIIKPKKRVELVAGMENADDENRAEK